MRSGPLLSAMSPALSRVKGRLPHWDDYLSRREPIFLVLILVIFLVVNLLTAERSPTVWQDEVLYADPAASLLKGQGFTSAAWPAQPKEQLWAGNAPLHTLLLVPWMWVWGFGPTAVRSVNYAYIAVAAVLLWVSVHRLQLIHRPALRLAFVALVLCGQGVAFGYRSGRYDSIGVLVVAAALFATTQSSSRLRQSMLAVLGFLMPLAGLQLLPFLTVLGVLLIIFLGVGVLRHLAPLAIGCLFGTASLVLSALALGVWQAFRESVRVLGGIGFSPSQAFLGQLAGKGSAMVWAFLSDLSALGVVLCMALAASVALMTRQFRWRSPEVFGLTVAVAVPLGLAVTGKFVSYYSWMVFLPSAVCCFMVFEGWLDTAPVRGLTARRLLTGSFGGLLGLAVAVGLPLRLTRTVTEWGARDYAPVESLVRAHLGPTDWAYCTFSAYYPAKDVAEVVFLPSYSRVMRPDEKGRIGVLVVAPNESARVQALIGGEWREVGDRLAARELTPAFGMLQKAFFGQATTGYRLTVLRRVSDLGEMR